MSHRFGSGPLAHYYHWTLIEIPLRHPAVVPSPGYLMVIILQNQSLHVFQQVIDVVDVRQKGGNVVKYYLKVCYFSLCSETFV